MTLRHKDIFLALVPCLMTAKMGHLGRYLAMSLADNPDVVITMIAATLHFNDKATDPMHNAWAGLAFGLDWTHAIELLKIKRYQYKVRRKSGEKHNVIKTIVVSSANIICSNLELSIYSTEIMISMHF